MQESINKNQELIVREKRILLKNEKGGSPSWGLLASFLLILILTVNKTATTILTDLLLLININRLQ